jgi:hypothetical protein
MLAYLASSAFGHLYRKIDCTAADIGGLRKAVYSRTVSIPLGLHNLEEIVLARQASPQATAARLRLLLSISNWRVLLKPCGQLLADDLRAFAANAAPSGPFLRGAMQNAVTTGISEFLVANSLPGAARGSRRHSMLASSRSTLSATRRRRRRRSPSAPASARNAGGAGRARFSR